MTLFEDWSSPSWFSRAVENKANPNEVIKIPVNVNDPAKFETMIERQLKGNQLLDELGIDNPRITGKGTITLDDGRKLPVMTQEKVNEDFIMQKLIKEQKGKLLPDQQVAVLDMIQRANEKGILLGDIKYDNIYFTKGESGWKCGILDPDYIGPPKGEALLERSVAEIQWTQISGKAKMNGEIWDSEFAAGAVMEKATGGGSSGGMAKYLDDDLVQMIQEPEKLKSFLKESKAEKLKEGLSKNEGYQKLTDERNAVAERVDAGTKDLDKINDKLEENTGSYKAWLEKMAKKQETPDTGGAENAARSFEQTLDEVGDAQNLALVEQLRLDGMPEEHIRKLLEGSGRLPDVTPPPGTGEVPFSLDEDLFGFSKGGKQ